MPVQKQPTKSAVSVSEMAEMCQLSRSRFYDLMNAGVFPQPVRHPSSKRPIYDLELQKTCLEIRRTGIGHNGEPVLFNAKREKSLTTMRNRRASSPSPANADDYSELVESLKGLGLTASTEAVGNAVRELYPTGWKDEDRGEVIRRVFLHLQHKR
jgi:hypothetical protein